MRTNQNTALMIIALFLCAFGAMVTSATNTYAQTTQAHTEQNNEQRVQIRLLPEKGSVTGGETIWVGIDKSIIPHWHVYWKNPGDSGISTRIQWEHPENLKGASFSDTHWPTPKRLPYGPLMNYGYEKNVVLLQKLTLPEDIPEGPLTFNADIELLVCKEECIPEYGTYSFTLNGPESESEDNTVFFANAVSKLPQKVSWDSHYTKDNDNFIFETTLPDNLAEAIQPDSVVLYPLEWGLVENAKEQAIAINDNNTLTIMQPLGEREFEELEGAEFVIEFNEENEKYTSIQLKTPYIENNTSEQSTSTQNESTIGKSSHTDTSGFSVWKAIFYAFIGGIILNLMPCVFPVLSIKALSLVKIADKHPDLARLHGLSYTAGVVLSFLLIAATLLLLKGAGSQIGWGFQLQNPIVIGALAYLLFIIGLNLIGAFEFNGGLISHLSNMGNTLTQGQNVHNSFFTGVLATVVATPCTAPFMAAAIGFALTQGTIANLAIFASLGLGLALPYLLLSLAPALQKALPKPGAWMNTFKEFLAFPIFISAIWLVWVFSKQTTPDSTLQLLLGMSALAFGIWVLQHAPSKARTKSLIILLAIISFVLAIWVLFLPHHTAAKETNQTTITEEKFGEAYTPEKLKQALKNSNQPIFVEMTADWCITCKLNHAVAINTKKTKTAFAEHNVRYFVGDWTHQDPNITKFLNDYGRNGVPIYVFYGAKDAETEKRPEAIVLPQILTPGTIPNTITKKNETKNNTGTNE